ncbi:hypothetical protein [Sphingobium chungbukense]|uniref:Uncharacterized protein n=1 Tax=Sphingobium chungbukense TaxID=56193 RepID=A0A0M3AR02_9SPHN|nr:hypothetical protein [Sphingobium chungbukense]KKW92642.1 hypothetical protein YP76_06815 [Sphingobium chungbukense]
MTTDIIAALEDLTRPIVGIENRTAQEAFDIMADRVRSKFAALSTSPAGQDGVARGEDHGWVMYGPDGNWHWANTKDLHECIDDQRPASLLEKLLFNSIGNRWPELSAAPAGQEAETLAQKQAREVMNPGFGSAMAASGGQSYNVLSSVEPAGNGREVLPDCITNGDVEAWIFSHQDKDADMEAARMALFRFRSSLSSAQPAVTEENGGHCYCWCHPNAGTIGCSPCCDAEDNYLPPSKRDPALSSVEPAGNGREAVENAFIAGWEAQKAGRSFAAAMNDHIPALSSPPAADQEAVKCKWCNDTGWTIGNGTVREGCLSCDAQINMVRATHPAPALDGVRAADIERIIKEQMREWWDEICADTGCHPLDFERRGKALWYDERHWTQAVAKYAAQKIAALSSPSEGRLREAASIIEQFVKYLGDDPWHMVGKARDFLAGISTPLSHDAEGLRGWQPIETAPVDGTEIMLAIPKITSGYFVHIGWYSKNDAFPWRFIDTFSTEPHGCCDDEDEDRTPVNGARYDARMLWQPLPATPATSTERGR